MSILLSIVGLVFGSYLIEPDLFKEETYVAVSKHETLKECKVVKKDKQICVGDEPSFLYVRSE